MTKFRALILSAAVLVLGSCEDPGTGSVTLVPAPCADPDSISLPRLSRTVHTRPDTVNGKTTTLEGVTWASGAAVEEFFGTRDIKFVFTINPHMYLVTYETGEANVTLISSGDEALGGGEGNINSPLFSPDGRKIAYAGTVRGKPAFIREAVSGEGDAKRVPLDPKAHPTADPHWYQEDGKTFVYFSTLSGLVEYNADCQQLFGGTYRVEVREDLTVDSIRATGLPGAFRGGLSKDGNWAGTSYANSALFDKSNSKIHLLGGEAQQCNSSINPFPAGSRNMDYLMILAFGGPTSYSTIDGSKAQEQLHENLWIYNKDDKIVWQAKRPDSTYKRYDKPEWSTHPDFATAVAIKCEEPGCEGDLFAVRIGDLANAVEDTVMQARDYLKLGTTRFTSESYSHLWVAP